MAVKKGLGKGLDALISVPEGGETAAAVLEIDINRIEPTKEQPRRDFNDGELAELAESIRVHGVLQPLLVRQEGGYYVIIAGERRWRAARIAGLRTVPVIVREMDRRETFEVALIENLQRQDLNPMEEAESYQRLSAEYGMKQEDISKRLGKSRSAVANALRYLNLPANAREMLRDGTISAGHAKVILGADDEAEMSALAERVRDEGLSVRELERVMKEKPAPKRAKKEPPADNAAYAGVERELSGVLGTKTRIKANKDGSRGRLEIEFFTKDELDRLYLILKNVRNK